MKKSLAFFLILAVGVASWFGSATVNKASTEALIASARDAAYQSGYDEGVKYGKNVGYDSGYSAGVRDAQQSSSSVRSNQSATPAEKQSWPGVDPEREVYVSDRSKTVHSTSTCSGMKYYTAMFAYEAYAHSYKRCEHCW